MDTQPDLTRLLSEARVIAVVGHSDKPYRTSYRIAQYLRAAGYRVYAVNPEIEEAAGEPAYANLAALPEPVDIVNVFRRREHLDGVVAEAIAAGAGAVWGQLGVSSRAAAQRAEAAGLPLVMDRCIMVDHRRLLG
ncbi:MAG: CoA-binding protein [Anaerolineales bacterium]|nr:CoA-binding protein [Anaerolineales bacterium]